MKTRKMQSAVKVTKAKTQKAIAGNKRKAMAQIKVYLGIRDYPSRSVSLRELSDRVIPDAALNENLGAVSKLAKLFQGIADKFMQYPDKVIFHIRAILNLGAAEPGMSGTEPDADAEFIRLVREEGMSRADASRIAIGRNYAGATMSRGKKALGE